MKRVHIIGRKNSGKTTLIVALVEELTARDYVVGTIKHTHHQHEFDVPGKDSHRHREAGAAVVGLIAPSMSAVFIPHRRIESEAREYGALLPMFAACDILLVEGDSQTNEEKIEVWRAGTHLKPMASDDSSICAVVSDDPVDLDVPIWPRADVAGLADELLRLASGDHVRDRLKVSVLPNRPRI